MNFVKRVLQVCVGLLLFAFGLYMGLQANIGLASWNCFTEGVAAQLGVSYGTVSIVTGLIILAIDLCIKEKIGIATIINIFLIGKAVDLFKFLNIIPLIKNFWLGLAIFLVSQLVIALASYMYIKPGMSAGPRDSLMRGLNRIFPKMPVGIVRFSIELFAVVVGAVCGAKIGVGTIIGAFGVSLAVQLVFKWFKFDIKSVRQETAIESLKGFYLELKGGRRKNEKN